VPVEKATEPKLGDPIMGLAPLNPTAMSFEPVRLIPAVLPDNVPPELVVSIELANAVRGKAKRANNAKRFIIVSS
jgi:hypothetical protein